MPRAIGLAGSARRVPSRCCLGQRALPVRFLRLLSRLQFGTADFPQKGIQAYKLNLPETQLNGNPSATAGARLVKPEIFYDSQGSSLMVAHGVDKVMIPARFF